MIFATSSGLMCSSYSLPNDQPTTYGSALRGIDLLAQAGLGQLARLRSTNTSRCPSSLGRSQLPSTGETGMPGGFSTHLPRPLNPIALVRRIAEARALSFHPSPYFRIRLQEIGLTYSTLFSSPLDHGLVVQAAL